MVEQGMRVHTQSVRLQPPYFIPSFVIFFSKVSGGRRVLLRPPARAPDVPLLDSGQKVSWTWEKGGLHRVW